MPFFIKQSLALAVIVYTERTLSRNKGWKKLFIKLKSK